MNDDNNTMDIDIDDYDFTADVSIQIDKLEIEWIRQPMLAEKYGMAWSTAKAAVESLKLQADVVISDLDAAARADFVANKIKYTEAMVTHAVHKTKEYTTINNKLIQARRTQENLSIAMKAIDQRKNALENLVKLLGLQYFGTPTEPRTIDEIMSMVNVSSIHRDRAFDKVSKKLKKRQTSSNS